MFRRYPIGYFHIDIAELRTEEGKLYLFVAIDRTSKFAFARLVRKAGKLAAAQFLRDLVAAVPLPDPRSSRTTACSLPAGRRTSTTWVTSSIACAMSTTSSIA